MADATPPDLTLRYMRPADIPDVLIIDRASFDPAWPARSYQFEINESHCSYMTVLEQTTTTPVSGIRRLWEGLRGQAPTQPTRRAIVGYGGLWKIQDEGHISTIASHPDHRGHGYGELLLLGMLLRSVTLGATYAVLEVRVSNTVAQALYRKYRFAVTSVKERYYHNNNEDAYEMRVDFDDSAYIRWLHSRYDAFQQRTPFTDQYAYTRHPRGIGAR